MAITRMRRILRRVCAAWAEGMVMSDPLMYCLWLHAKSAAGASEPAEWTVTAAMAQPTPLDSHGARLLVASGRPS